MFHERFNELGHGRLIPTSRRASHNNCRQRERLALQRSQDTHALRAPRDRQLSVQGVKECSREPCSAVARGSTQHREQLPLDLQAHCFDSTGQFSRHSPPHASVSEQEESTPCCPAEAPLCVLPTRCIRAPDWLQWCRRCPAHRRRRHRPPSEPPFPPAAASMARSRRDSPVLAWILRVLLLLNLLSAVGFIVYSLMLQNPPKTALPM